MSEGQPTSSCPQCGAPARETDRFCGGCGFDLAAHRSSTSARNPKRTMLGMSALDDSGAPDEGSAADPGDHEAAPPSTRQGAPRARTMLGMQSPVGPPANGADAPQGAPAGSSSSSSAPPQLAATQVGLSMPTPPGPGAGTGGAAAGAQAGRGKNDKSTMLGMPAVPSAAPPPAGSPSKEGGGTTPPPATGRTMLGLPASSVPPPSESMRPPGMPAAMPGAGGEGRRRNEVAYRSSWPEPAPATSSGSLPYVDGLPARGRRGGGGRGSLVMFGLGGLLVLALVLGGLLWWWTANRGPEVDAEVAQTARGEVLRVTVPEARPGSKVRLGGAERILEGNRAEFPLAAEGLAVGENALALDVVGPDGDVETAKLSLRVDFRVRADLAGLRDAEPAVRVIVDAPPDTEASLDGTALPLNDQGRGERRFPLTEVTPDEDGYYDLSVAYHLELPDGEIEEGRVRSRIPYTELQIDRPGRSLVTDDDEVEIAGAVGEGGTVTIDGDAVELREGRFLERVALDEVGERTVVVVARQPGKAPVTKPIAIRRVRSLEDAARDFDADDELTYARVAQNPSIYKGQKVEMVGRVYNVRVQDGRSTLQVLVKDCPRGEACPLWVVYPAATDATLNDWVRILGEVAGEQQFKAETDRIVTVPRVDATYVLETRP